MIRKKNFVTRFIPGSRGLEVARLISNEQPPGLQITGKTL